MSGKRCRCGSERHEVELCPETQCRECGTWGHQRARCPSIECKYCHQTGHMVKDCPKTPYPDPPRPSRRPPSSGASTAPPLMSVSFPQPRPTFSTPVLSTTAPAPSYPSRKRQAPSELLSVGTSVKKILGGASELRECVRMFDEKLQGLEEKRQELHEEFERRMRPLREERERLLAEWKRALEVCEIEPLKEVMRAVERFQEAVGAEFTTRTKETHESLRITEVMSSMPNTQTESPIAPPNPISTASANIESTIIPNNPQPPTPNTDSESPTILPNPISAPNTSTTHPTPCETLRQNTPLSQLRGPPHTVQVSPVRPRQRTPPEAVKMETSPTPEKIPWVQRPRRTSI